MPELAQKPEDKKIIAWASTKTGDRFPIFEGEDKEAALKRHLEHIQKNFTKRFNIAKTSFKIREEVVYDAFTKEGIVAGFVGDSIRILTEGGQLISKDKNFVYKKSELIGGVHWDGISLKDRLDILKHSNVSQDFVNSTWYYIPYEVRNVIQKAEGPAGYEGGGLNTSTSGVFNPVHEDKSVSERIKEQASKQPGKSVAEADKEKEPSGGPKTVPTSEDTPPKDYDYQQAKQERSPNTEKIKEKSMVG